jgi:hypothetical protein
MSHLNSWWICMKFPVFIRVRHTGPICGGPFSCPELVLGRPYPPGTPVSGALRCRHPWPTFCSIIYPTRPAGCTRWLHASAAYTMPLRCGIGASARTINCRPHCPHPRRNRPIRDAPIRFGRLLRRPKILPSNILCGCRSRHCPQIATPSL